MSKTEELGPRVQALETELSAVKKVLETVRETVDRQAEPPPVPKAWDAATMIQRIIESDSVSVRHHAYR